MVRSRLGALRFGSRIIPDHIDPTARRDRHGGQSLPRAVAGGTVMDSHREVPVSSAVASSYEHDIKWVRAGRIHGACYVDIPESHTSGEVGGELQFAESSAGRRPSLRRKHSTQRDSRANRSSRLAHTSPRFEFTENDLVRRIGRYFQDHATGPAVDGHLRNPCTGSWAAETGLVGSCQVAPPRLRPPRRTVRERPAEERSMIGRRPGCRPVRAA